MSRADFRAMVSAACAETSLEDPKEAVEKEILHYDILHAMNRARHLSGFTGHLPKGDQ